MTDEERINEEEGAAEASATGPTEERPVTAETAEQPPTAETAEQPPTAETAEQPRPPKRLVRTRGDRMIAGVAGGLGRYFDVDPVIFRIAFGVSVFFGGLGVLAYIALALFVPSEGEGQQAPVQRSRGWLAAAIVLVAVVLGSALGGLFFWDGGWGHHPWGALWVIFPIAVVVGAVLVLRDRGGEFSIGRVLAAILIAGAVVAGFFALAVISLFATATGHGVVAAALVIAVGALLLGAAFLGGARWLIVPAMALATGVGVAAAADLDFEGGVGQRSYTPLTTAAIPTDGYTLGVGEMTVDLRQLDWRAHQVVDLNARLGVGELTVAVPDDVCVEADTHAGAGSLVVAGEQTDGASVDNDQATGSTATPRLRLDAEVDLGELRVINDDEAQLDPDVRRLGGQDSAALRAAETKACATS